MTTSQLIGSTRARFAIGAILVVAGAIGAVSMKGDETRDLVDALTHKKGAEPRSAERLVELVPDKKNTIRLASDGAAAQLGLRIDEVAESRGPQPLRLPGRLSLDPNKLIHVHSRFGGEAVSIGTTEAGGGARPLQYGDHVKRGQLLATVWSKEIGEKKSELLDANSKLDTSRANLARLEKLTPGVVTVRVMDEARRDVELDLIAVARVERTLRSWRMTDDEIAAIYEELAAIKNSRSNTPDVTRRWAEIEVRAAIDGVIVEKSFNVGDMVDSDDDLFKLADLSKLQVLADIYEEDLGSVRALPPEDRRWTISLISGDGSDRIQGTFDLIGSAINPTQRTGVLIGLLDNRAGKLTVGQFITATIELPNDPNSVAIPESALIEEGDTSTVFVEVDRAKREFTRRRIAVVRRSADTIYVASRPQGSELEGLSVGERVVTSGSLGLGGELEIQRTSQAAAR